jgi:hypothetical protein
MAGKVTDSVTRASQVVSAEQRLKELDIELPSPP